MSITFHPNGDITGTGASNFGQTGTVLQTVHNFSNTKLESSDDFDIISATITPSSTSSKILFLYTGNVAQENNSGLEWGYVAYRNSTEIRLGSNYSRATFQAFGTDNRAAAVNSNGTYTITGTLLDEPNTTSAVTYKLGWRANGSGTLYVNRTVGDADTGDYERYMSIISATEIAQ